MADSLENNDGNEATEFMQDAESYLDSDYEVDAGINSVGDEYLIFEQGDDKYQISVADRQGRVVIEASKGRPTEARHKGKNYLRGEITYTEPWESKSKEFDDEGRIAEDIKAVAEYLTGDREREELPDFINYQSRGVG